MAHGTIRSFLAVEISETLKNEARLFVETIQSKCLGFRFIPPQNWHLTLHFLGPIEPQKIEGLAARLPDALKEARPFSISLEGLGVFPEGKKPRILWLGIGGNLSELFRLKKQLDEVLLKMHFRIEAMRYHPHVTIARSKSAAARPFLDLEQSFQSQATDEIRHVTLFRSDLSSQGARHIPLQTFSFGRS